MDDRDSLRIHNDISAAMDPKPEVKVPVRLSTRDPSIQLEQEPGPLLVQTCKYSNCRCALAIDARIDARHDIRIHTDCLKL